MRLKIGTFLSISTFNNKKKAIYVFSTWKTVINIKIKLNGKIIFTGSRKLAKRCEKYEFFQFLKIIKD